MKDTKNLRNRPSLRGLVLALAVTAMTSYVAQAHPYASGITNSSGTINFFLNENADSVKVVFDNGTSATNDLGALTKGLNSFALGAHTNYSIIVSKVGSGAPSSIVVDTNRFLNFWGPRGVTVNRSPKTANFGRIYVANALAGTQPLGGVSATNGTRVVTRGVYAINPDQTDAVGQGDTARTYGMTLNPSTTYSPYKLSVGPDDMVYVGDGGGNYLASANITNAVWMVKPDLSSGTNLFPVYANPEICGGVQGTPYPFGSYAAGTLGLYVVSWDLVPYQTIWSYTNFTTLPNTATPTAICNAGISSVQGVLADFTIGRDGKIITAEPRAGGVGNVPIYVFDSNGTPLWNSQDNWAAANGSDPFANSGTVAVSDDGKMMLCSVRTTGNFSITQLTNGIPDPATFTLVTTGLGATAAGVAFDAANNVYVVSSALSVLRIYSLGMTTTAITGNDVNGTNGTFQLISPATTVSVTTDTNEIYEAGATTATLTLTRSNPSSDYSTPLPVSFSFAGTATFGADYISSRTNSVLLAAGQISTNITIKAVDDTIPEPTETVIFNLGGGGAYSTVVPRSQTISIVDNETPFFQITALSTNVYEGNPYDFAQATIVRWGDTNQTVTLDTPNFVCTGTAVSNVDYYVTNLPVTFNPGDVTHTVRLLYPIDNNSYDLAKTITVGLVAGTGYTVSNSTFTTTLTESTLSKETVLWSDDLHSDTSGNWTQFFASLNPASGDHIVNWGYDYSVDLIPPAPHSGGDTHGLKMTVNKSSLLQAAALNFYPILSTSSYSNEMTQFDISGGTLPAGFKLRESPTLASTGKTTIQPATGGGYIIRSFFDVWLELSPDNGATWIPDGSGSPCHLVLYGPNPTNWWSGNSLPPLTGYYTNDSNLWQGNFGGTYLVKNLVSSAFTANFPPPLPGVLQTGSYDSTAALQLSTDSGGSFPDYAATSALTVTTTNTLVGTTNFGGNYALRFDMYLTEGTVSTTEYALFGINHSGTKTNWFRNSTGGVPGGWAFDGLWYDVEADGAALGDYVVYSSPTLTNTTPTVYPASYSSRLASTLTSVFKAPPYTTNTTYSAGTAANQAGSVTPSWASVEINQIGNLVTWKINNTVIFTITNAPPYNTNAYYTNGNIMLGYCDAYDSVGSGASVIYANVQVVQLGLPAITTAPTSAVTPAGANTNFTIVASTGTGITNYQWFKNGTAVAGATGSTLAFSPVVLANYGTYTVSVFDGTYSSLSSAVTLIPPAPSIVTSPSAITTTSGTATNMTVTAITYTGATNYQWYSNNVSVGTSGTNKIYSFTAGLSTWGTNKVTVSDGFTTPALTSSVAKVFPVLPVINTPPGNRAGAAPGGSVTFSVAATSYSGKTNYQWLTNSAPITGATAATLTLNNLQSPASFLPGYAVAVNDGYNPAITSAPPATLTLAIRQSLSQSVAGTTLSLSFGSEVGPGYVVEYKTNLTDATWKGIKTNAGTGSTITVTDSLVAAPTRFYRIRMQ